MVVIRFIRDYIQNYEKLRFDYQVSFFIRVLQTVRRSSEDLLIFFVAMDTLRLFFRGVFRVTARALAKPRSDFLSVISLQSIKKQLF